jgi:hypothetical protein
MRITAVTSLLALALAFSSASRSEEGVEVTVCQLLADPPAYNHKLVRVRGQVSFAFEEFTLHATDCKGRTGSIWLEYGGTVKSGAIPSGWTRTRDQPLVIEGIPTVLVEDSAFQTFDDSIHKPPSASVAATFIGRYFAGKAGAGGVKEWRGYGMWGMYSLLVIQQVISSDATK